MNSAMKPTLTKAPKMLLSISICNALTTCQMRNMATMPTKMLMPDVPFNSRYSQYMSPATKMMSMMSKSRMSINSGIILNGL